MSEVDESHYNASFTLGLIRASAIAVVIGGSAPYVAYLYGDERLFYILLALAGNTIVAGAINPKYVTFARTLNFRQEFYLSTLSKLFGLIIALTIAFLYRSYWALVGALAISQFVTVVVSYIQVPYRPSVSLMRSKDILGFSIWVVLTQFVNTLTWRLDQLFIGYFIGKDQLGRYSVGDNLAMIPTRELTQPLFQVLFPAFALLRDDPTRLQGAYLIAQASLVSVALPAGIGFALIADPFVRLFLGQEWLDAIPVIQVAAIAVSIQTIAGPVQPIALSHGAVKLLFQRDSINLCQRLPLALGGLFFAGLPGLLAGRAASSVVGTFISMLLVKRITGITVRQQLVVNQRNAAACVMLVVMGIATQLAISATSLPARELIAILATIMVGGISYVGMLWVLWIMDGRPKGPESEVMRVLSKFTRKTAML